MLKINEILAKSTCVPTLHGLSHSRDDGRNLWFSYIDGDGRGIYFKVCKNALGSYELYSVILVSDKNSILPKKIGLIPFAGVSPFWLF